MRKYITLLLFFVMSVASFAVDYTPMDKNAANALYLEATLQTGTTGNINIYMKSSEEIGTITMQFFLPEGIEIADDVKGTAAEGTISIYPGQPDGSVKLAISGLSFNNSSVTKIASFPVTVNAAPGTYKINAYQYQMVTPAIGEYKYNNVSTDLIVQKAAVIEEMPEGYALAVNPFVAAEGENNIDIMFKAPETIKDLSFDLTLPKGMFLYNSDFDSTIPVIVPAVVTAPSTGITITPIDEQKVKVKIAGNKLKKTGVDSKELAKAFSLTAYVFSEAEGMGEEYAYEPNSLQTVMISNISMGNLDGSKIVTGESLASVIYGQPAAQEAILYGNYDEATASAFTTALKNVAIADVTVATVAEGAKFNDVLVNEKGGNSYYTRTSANYGTTVLPLDLTTANVDELYTIASMDAKSIVLTEAENVPANTPCIFKGTINVEGATPTLGVPSEQGLGQTTFKGTYEATNIADGAGYYIAADGKFYSDGASVAPFRGYFDGAIAGVKEFRVSLVTPDGLIDITDQFSSEDIYNLQGIRVQNAKKGVNIVGGKKVYVK